MKQITLTGIIGIDIQPANIMDVLKEANGDDVSIDFVSVGGYIYEGFQIYNLLKDYPGKKIITLNGLVASIAAYITTAADHVIAKENSTFMIHNALGGAMGDYKVLEKEAKELKRLNSVIGQAYARRTEDKLDKILSMMEAETYLYGQEIIDAGFADEIISQGEPLMKEEAINRAKESRRAFVLPVRQDDVVKAAAMCSNAGVSGSKNIKGEGEIMNKIEVLNFLKGTEITLDEVINVMNSGDRLCTPEERAVLNSLKGIENPKAEIEKLKETIRQNEETVKDALLDKAFGVPEEGKNLLRAYANKIVGDKRGDELDEVVKNLKDDPIALKLAESRADYTSEQNTIGISSRKDSASDGANTSTRVIKV